MKYFIINTSIDFQDEEYTLRSIVTEKEKNIILKSQDFIEQTLKQKYMELYFGSEEIFHFEIKEVFNLLLESEEISKKEINTLKKYESSTKDILKLLIQWTLDKLEETNKPIPKQLKFLALEN